MQQEKEITVLSGYTMAAVIAVVAILAIVLIGSAPILSVLAVPIVLFLLRGLFMVVPNGSCVMTLFGKYRGTVFKIKF